MTTALTTTEHQKYLECNAVIEHGLQTFFDVGTALMVVRNDRLYREEYGTFEDYCQQKWGWTRQRANQLIASADVVANLAEMTTIVVKPTTESQARALTKLEPEKQRTVWKDVVETAPKGKVTAKHVQAVVEQHKEPAKPKPEPEPEPVVAAPTEPPKQPVGAPTKFPTFDQAWNQLSEVKKNQLRCSGGSEVALKAFYTIITGQQASH